LDSDGSWARIGSGQRGSAKTATAINPVKKSQTEARARVNRSAENDANLKIGPQDVLRTMFGKNRIFRAAGPRRKISLPTERRAAAGLTAMQLAA